MGSIGARVATACIQLDGGGGSDGRSGIGTFCPYGVRSRWSCRLLRASRDEVVDLEKCQGCEGWLHWV